MKLFLLGKQGEKDSIVIIKTGLIFERCRTKLEAQIKHIIPYEIH